MKFLYYLVLLLAALSLFEGLEACQISSCPEACSTSTAELQDLEPTQIALEHTLVNGFSTMKRVSIKIRRLADTLTPPPQDARIDELEPLLDIPVSSITSTAPPANPTQLDLRAYASEVDSQPATPVDYELQLNRLIADYNRFNLLSRIPSFVLLAMQKAMQKAMQTDVSIFRTQESLDEGVKKVTEIDGMFSQVGIKDRSMIWNSDI
ncbi:hypothetical protein F5Y06DRAFT_303331 [Hypoxylon sp. FL0890]|nr:hypothetical protein F5Y06DRAFT_303331 [Hypoxylon sp. FL0890]